MTGALTRVVMRSVELMVTPSVHCLLTGSSFNAAGDVSNWLCTIDNSQESQRNLAGHAWGAQYFERLSMSERQCNTKNRFRQPWSRDADHE